MAESVIHYIESTDSTMLEARRIVESAQQGLRPPVLSGTVVQAGYQTAGRGRIAERKWTSKPGDSLLFTVIFSKADLSRRMSGRSFTLLPLLCGLAVAEAIGKFIKDEQAAAYDPEIKIKWPNDVLVNSRKISGILCEASGEWVYAGIGINLNQKNFDANLRRPACSISMLTGRCADGNALLRLVLRQLDDVLGRDGWRSEVESRLYRLGELVEMKSGLAEESAVEAQNFDGVLSGIDSSGAVLINTVNGVTAVSSGELRI